MDKQTVLDLYFSTRPKTFKALQRLVMAASDAQNARGKKSMFGADKFQPACQKFRSALVELANAASVDGDCVTVHLDDSWSRYRGDNDIIELANSMLKQFKIAFPNWPDAYAFWDEFYIESENEE